MTQCHLKRLWGTIGGALAGWMFGQLNVIWAWLYEAELWKIVYQGNRSYDPSMPPITVRMASHPNAVLIFGVLFGATLGFLAVYTLTSHKTKEVSSSL